MTRAAKPHLGVTGDPAARLRETGRPRHRVGY
jgi:hypothetical protein